MQSGRASQRPMHSPTTDEVLVAIRSLYADELKPLGRLILKRLRENAAAAEASRLRIASAEVDPEHMPQIDPKHLRALCEGCPQVRVGHEEGREYSALLVGEASHFLDLSSRLDIYPPQLWADLVAYLQSLERKRSVLPTGRYVCARMLISQRLPFLSGLSMGQVCHIVQLASTAKRLLGHRDGKLVPFGASEEWAKEQCSGQPDLGAPKVGQVQSAAWREAPALLRELLSVVVDPEPGVMSLSNLKRVFRERFNVELSEARLGHAKLLDLLQDPRFQDVCTVRAQRNGQVEVRRKEVVCPCWQSQTTLPPEEAGDRVPMWWSPPWTSPHVAAPSAWDLVSLGVSPQGGSSAAVSDSLCSPSSSSSSSISSTRATWSLESESDATSGREDERETEQEMCCSWTAASEIEEEPKEVARSSREMPQFGFSYVVKNTFIHVVVPTTGSAKRRSSSSGAQFGR